MMKPSKICNPGVAFVLAALVSWPLSAGELADTTWRITLSSNRLGPVEILVNFERRGDTLHAFSSSGALDHILEFPGAKDPSLNLREALLHFTLLETGTGYQGETVSPRPGKEVSLQISEDGLQGRISGGLLQGQLSGRQLEEAEPDTPLRDYPAIVKSLQAVIAEKIYNPRDLETDAFLAFKTRMAKLAEKSTDDLDMLLGFGFAWTDEAFSHFQLSRSERSAVQKMEQFDNYRIGKQLAYVNFDEDIAILSVHTMMGADTIEYLEAAFDEIAESRAKALIVDLRGNTGGAFAVKPLVEHMIQQPLDGGYFVSQKWNAQHEELPTPADLAAIPPWQGWSLVAFWKSVQHDGLLRIRFRPDTPGFKGPAFVLIDSKTASAAEMATAALSASGLVTLVGEKTAGQMLSQSFFDVDDGYLVSLPVADYISAAIGRIEGSGITPDVFSPSSDALSTAMLLARQSIDSR